MNHEILIAKSLSAQPENDILKKKKRKISLAKEKKHLQKPISFRILPRRRIQEIFDHLSNLRIQHNRPMPASIGSHVDTAASAHQRSGNSAVF